MVKKGIVHQKNIVEFARLFNYIVWKMRGYYFCSLHLMLGLAQQYLKSFERFTCELRMYSYNSEAKLTMEKFLIC